MRNHWLDGLEGQAFDVYENWIICKLSRHWYHCRVATGFVAVADWCTPNEHIGIFRESEIVSAKGIVGSEIEGCPYLLIGPQVTENLHGYGPLTIRYGRTRTVGVKPTIILDTLDPVPHIILADKDDVLRSTAAAC